MQQLEDNGQPKETPESVDSLLEDLSNRMPDQKRSQTSEILSNSIRGEGKGLLSPPRVLEAAKEYVQRGWSPLPVPFQGKAPRIKSWTKLRLQETDLPNYFKDEPQNIGVLLEEASGGLVDIDLDAPEAITLADAFLPPTAWMFGRTSKPCSHRLYISNPTPEKTLQFETNEGIMLVELRSTGAQTIFPPSVHESGEPITFHQQGELTSISGEELAEKVARLAAAALLVRHWPQRGSRQHVAMPLAGGLTRAGWDNQNIHHFIYQVARAAGDEEATQRVNCVDRTAQRTQSDVGVTGWPRLKELIGALVVDRLRNWLFGHGTAKERIQSIRTGRGKEAEKYRKISEIVMRDLWERGNFYKTPYDLYYFDQQDTRLFSLIDPEFRARINEWFDINGSETSWRFVLEDLKTEGLLRGQETTIYRFAFYDREKGLLYVYQGHEKVFRVTPEGWSVVPNGSDGILFLNPDMEPVKIASDEAHSGALEKVLSIPNFDGSGNLTPKQESQLYWLWVFSLFFESLLPTKPILLLLGVKGSGKTTALRALLRALFGKKAQVLTMSKEKEDAFLSAVTSHHMVAIDNLDGEIKWLPNHLATAATGGDVPLRKLYTTNELVRYPVRCFLAVTSRDPDSLTRDDVVDRLLTLKVDRIDPFIPENTLMAEIEAARFHIWTELLQHLQQFVSTLQTAQSHGTSHRLADFASFAMNIGELPRK